MQEKGTVTIYVRGQFMDINGVLHRYTKTIHEESNMDAQQARGLYLDVRGMNPLILDNIYYTWKMD